MISDGARRVRSPDREPACWFGLTGRIISCAALGKGLFCKNPSGSTVAAAAKAQGVFLSLRKGKPHTSGAARAGGAGIPAWAGPGRGRSAPLRQLRGRSRRQSLSLVSRRRERTSRCRPAGFWSAMSLWADKHRPGSLARLDFHREQAARLRNLVSEARGALCPAPPRSGGLPAGLCPGPRRPPGPLGPLFRERIPPESALCLNKGETLLCRGPSLGTDCSECL